jgi:hypothetical protein
MKRYKIFPLLVARLYADIGTFNYANFSGKKRLHPVFSFLIQGDGRNILVDSGCMAEEMATVAALKGDFEDVRPLEWALKQRALGVENITDVIPTHQLAECQETCEGQRSGPGRERLCCC